MKSSTTYKDKQAQGGQTLQEKNGLKVQMEIAWKDVDIQLLRTSFYLRDVEIQRLKEIIDSDKNAEIQRLKKTIQSANDAYK
ncbi:hypothetical protein D5086_018801 [Populus alba]|uniref:Uncharacterized protein n=1 Tax=Populus alba TaxID=43335 RepID=A0ACC4BS02_POPAL